MSFQASAWARTVKTGSPARKAVLYAIAEDASPHDGKFDGYHCCYPGQERIGEGSEMSSRSVRPHLTELEERGLLRRFKRFKSGGAPASDWYVLPIKSDGTIASPEEFAALRDPRDDHRKNLPAEESTGGSQKRDHRKPASDYPLGDPVVGDADASPTTPPPLRDDAITGMEVEVAGPKQVARRGNGETTAEAETITRGFWTWAEAEGVALAQKYLSVRGIVKTALDNRVPPDAIKWALCDLGTRGEVVTTQSLQNALRRVRSNGQSFRNPADQDWFERSMQRASERDAAGGGTW